MKVSDNEFVSKTFPVSSSNFASKSVPTGSTSFATKPFTENTKKNWQGDNITSGPYGGEESKSRPFGLGVFGGVRHFKK